MNKGFCYIGMALSLGAWGCASTIDLEPAVDMTVESLTVFDEYNTVLSYEDGSVVAVSGERLGEDIELNVAVRNNSQEIVRFEPKRILVVHGDDVESAMVLDTYGPDEYIDHLVQPKLARISLNAHNAGWDAFYGVPTSDGTTQIDAPVTELASGSFVGRTEESAFWSHHASRSEEIRSIVEGVNRETEELAAKLLWDTVLDPGQYTFGKVMINAETGSDGSYRVVVPVGQDYHEFRFVQN